MTPPDQHPSLSALIEAIVGQLASVESGAFDLDGSDLCGALHRAIYFRAVTDLTALALFFHAGRTWRMQQPDDSALAHLFDDCVERSRHRLTRVRLTEFGRSILRLASILVDNLRPSSTRRAAGESECGVRDCFAFIAISRRFVFFFRDIVAGLAPSACAFITPENEHLNADVSAIGAMPVARSRPHIPLKTVRLNPLHPLCNEYLFALQSYFGLRELLQHLHPRAVIFAEGTSALDHIACLAARSLGIPTVRIQNGRAGVLHCGYRNMQFDTMLCWGEGFVERYRAASPGSHYVVTGNPFLDRSPAAPIERDGRTVALFTQPMCTTVSASDYALLLALARRLLDDHPLVRIVVRRHPSDLDMRFPELAKALPTRVRMMDSDTHPLSEVLEIACCAAGLFSTALTEAVAYDVVPLMIQTGTQHSVFPFPEREGAALLAHGLESAAACVADVLNDALRIRAMRPRMHAFRNRYFGPMDGQAMARTLAHIRQLEA